MRNKVLSVLVFLGSVNAFGGATGTGCTTNCTAMPEPSAFPELLVVLAGVGCLAWFMFRQSRPGGSSVPGATKDTDSGQ